jgi:sedoheptulose-bisphosphatase
MSRALVNYWIENKYTLRYSGGLVPDVYHILIKGQVSATLIIE